MHPESLARYKLQVYNPGSPIVSPKTDPLKSFPKNSPNPEDPLILTISSSRKRRSDSVPDLEGFDFSETPSKKPKMMTEEAVKALHNELRNENKKDMEEFKKDVAKDFAKEVATQIASLQTNLQSQLSAIVKTQVESTKAIDDNKEESITRFKALEDRLDNLEKSKIEGAINSFNESTIQDAVKHVVGKSPDSTWKASLAKEIFEHEHGLVIHGLRLVGENDAAKTNFILNFLKVDLKASQDLLKKIRVREVCRLGSDNGSGDPPPILIKLGHPTERNQLLPLSSNLKSGVTIDKNIPKLYQKCHKDFKRQAWKLKLLHGVKTQVVFEGFKMILRYKKNDDGVNKYNWVVEKEYFPDPSDLENLLATSSNKDPNKLDTPAIDNSDTAKCNRTVIVSAAPDSIKEANAKDELLKHIAENDHGLIDEIRFKSRGIILITCKDWVGCKHIADTYSKTNLLGKEIFCTLYKETDASI